MPRRKKAHRAAWASIAQIDESTWRIRFWASGADGYKRRSKTIRNATRMDAERVRSELMLQHSEDAQCPTVGDAWERWVLPDLERRVELGTLAPNSLKQYRSAWRAHVSPRWADVQMDAVRPLAVQRWLDGMGANQADNALGVLSSILDVGVRYELVEHNVARERYVMPSKTTIKKRDDGIWTLAELLGMDVAGEWWEAAYLLSAFGGLRVGESLGVRAADVELRDVSGVPVAFVHVSKQVTRNGDVLETLKTEQSSRTAFLVGRAALRLAAITNGMPDSWYLTHDGAGNAQPQYRLTRAWTRAGMAHPFRNLRNAWQTWMRWEVGVAPWAIEQAMGHRVAGVTGRYYDRPTDDVIAQVLADAYRAKPWD